MVSDHGVDDGQHSGVGVGDRRALPRCWMQANRWDERVEERIRVVQFGDRNR